MEVLLISDVSDTVTLGVILNGNVFVWVELASGTLRVIIADGVQCIVLLSDSLPVTEARSVAVLVKVMSSSSVSV